MQDLENTVKRAKLGDNNALEEIFTYFKPIVRGISQSFFLVGGDQEDLLQEGMIGLFGAVNDYDKDKGSFIAFSKLCIRRRIMTAITSTTRDKNAPLLNSVALNDELTDSAASPLEILLGKDKLSQLKSFIADNLTVTEQTVLNMFTEGYNYEEIVKRTGKPYKSVDTALQRARKKLKAAL